MGTENFNSFLSFNDECTIVKKSQERISVESGIQLTRVKIAAELVSFKIDNPCLINDTLKDSLMVPT